MARRIEKSEPEWLEQLGPERYAVCRRQGTEPPWSGEYHDCKDAGIYRCRCCGEPLFDSETKFNSGTGWPSFWAPIDPESVSEIRDSSHGMARTEVVCAACDGHLGHVFPDGPEPSGQRYCINSASLVLDRGEETQS